MTDVIRDLTYEDLPSFTGKGKNPRDPPVPIFGDIGSNLFLYRVSNILSNASTLEQTCHE